jgi:hypothetical protein
MVDSVRCLGMNISGIFAPSEHVAGIANKCYVLTSSLSALHKKGIKKEILLEIYKSMFESNLTYAIPIWGGYSEKCINRLQVLQNDAIRSILGIDRRSSISSLRSELGILTVRQLYKLEVLCFAFRNYGGFFEPEVTLPFKFGETFRARNELGIIKPIVNLTLTQNSLSYRMICEWNNLGSAYKKCFKIEKFRAGIKKLLLTGE